MKKGMWFLALLLGFALTPAQAAETKMAAPAPAAAKGDTKGAEGHAGHAMKGGEGQAMKAADMSFGQMLSSHAGMPEKMAEGATAGADMLEAHAALLGKEKDAQTEAKGMRAIAKAHRQVATDLKKVADEMKKAASWPAVPHDMAKMNADPKLMAAQKHFIEVHKEIIAMMQKAVSDMEAHQKAMTK